MDLKFISCPLCNSNDYLEIYHQKAEWLNLEYTNVVCKNCTFIFRNPTMDWEDYVELYKSRDSLLSGSLHVNYEEGSRSQKLRKERFVFLYDSIPLKGGTVLDIGGGDGFFLDGFDNSNWKKTLVEPSEYGKEANKKEIENINISIEEFNSYKKYDLITCMSVLEHILYPKEVIKKVAELLAEDGYFFFEVPDSLTPFIKISDFYSFEHISGFTLENINFLLDLFGFKLLYLDNKISIPNLRIIAKRKRNSRKKTADKEKISKSSYTKVIEVFNIYKKERGAFELEIKKKLEQYSHPNCHDKIAVYGAGNHTIQLLNIIDITKNISCFIDSDKNKQGTQFLGKNVHLPEDLENLDINIVILSSGSFQGEMYKRIEKFEKTRDNFKIIKLYPEGTI